MRRVRYVSAECGGVFRVVARRGAGAGRRRDPPRRGSRGLAGGPVRGTPVQGAEHSAREGDAGGGGRRRRALRRRDGRRRVAQRRAPGAGE